MSLLARIRMLPLCLGSLTIGFALAPASVPHPEPTDHSGVHANLLIQARARKTLLRAPWEPSIGDAASIGLRAEENSRLADVEMKKAIGDKDKSQTIADRNDKIVPALISTVNDAQDAERGAYAAEKMAKKQVAQVISATAQAAHDIVEAAVFQARQAAHMRAKAEAQARAKKIMEKMILEAPKAAKAAMTPWTDAWARETKIAGQYEKMADGMVAKSNALQGSVQLDLGASNAWRSMANLAKSQSLQQQANQNMDLAMAFNGAAGRFYNAAQDIRSREGLYMKMAMQASYHALVMHDPDAAPPMGLAGG